MSCNVDDDKGESQNRQNDRTYKHQMKFPLKQNVFDLMAVSPRTPPTRPPRLPDNQIISPPLPHRVTNVATIPQISCSRTNRFNFERIGNARLKIFRLRLPPELIDRKLDRIIVHAERYAQNLPHGWATDLYSLTKQDLALRTIPGMSNRIRPIFEYVSDAIKALYGCRKVVVDKNQPHILKYSVDSGHTGVQLHHDRCDVTANLALSKSRTYQGGGTYIPDAQRVVKLEQGECLLHPGSLVHGGMEVTQGTRYLMVTFAHLE